MSTKTKTTLGVARKIRKIDFTTAAGLAHYRNVVWTERSYLGLTQQQLADKAGVNLFTVWHHEHDVRYPRAETVGKILRALKLEGRWTIEI